MPYYKFGKNDLFRNVLTSYPEVSFYIYQGQIFYQNLNQQMVALEVPPGYVSLYELNINRSSFAGSSPIYPFMPKGASLTTFKTITTSSFSSMDYGAIVTGSYPMSASISTSFPNWGLTDATNLIGALQLQALKNILNSKKTLSPHYAYTASYGDFNWDKDSQGMTLLNVPSIFYGSRIKKGTVKLEFFLSGSSLGQLVDKNYDGALYQVSGAIGTTADNNGDVAGVVLYEEGIFLLTGSWALNTNHTALYRDDSLAATYPRWNAFGRLTESTLSSSYSINFSGSQDTSTLTMMCHAPAGDLNFSSNPTYVDYNATSSVNCSQVCLDQYITSSTQFFEPSELRAKNTVSSSYNNYNADFKKQTFITKIGIYDDNNNLIAIANLARPVKKSEARDLKFKLKLDI